MGNKNIDTTRLRRALAAAAALLAIVAAAVVAARCSSPSQVVTAPPQGPSAQEASAPVNAAAAAQARLDEWAGQRVAVAGVEWLDADAAVVTAALRSGEHVALTVVRTPAGWQAPWPPAAGAAGGGGPRRAGGGGLRGGVAGRRRPVAVDPCRVPPRTARGGLPRVVDHRGRPARGGARSADSGAAHRRGRRRGGRGGPPGPGATALAHRPPPAALGEE